MDLSVAFLGTGGAVPSARRNTASVLVARGGERLLFDCGEGTQRQMQRSLGLVQVDSIYFTHFHADHFLGLPGLLKTYDLTERERPLTIYGPRGLRDLIRSLGRVIGRIDYKVDLIEIEPGDAVACDGGEVRSFPVEHGVRACGYALVEERRPGRFDPEAAKRLGVKEGPDFAALQRGESVRGDAGPVEPDEVMGESRPGRTLVVTGDTAPCRATVEAARGAELLVHDASFSEEEAQRAADTGHSTVGQAAAVAREAEVKLLALVHISSRYHVGKVLDEAKEVFEPVVAPKDFDLIELPFPEKGEPVLVPNGARERGEDHSPDKLRSEEEVDPSRAGTSAKDNGS
ncbi:MAG TPA: ribonuclease Z [Solirubrobacterales bacterium]